MQKQLGQILKDMELVSEGHIQEALAIQRKQGGRIGDILVSLGYVAAEEIFLALAFQAGISIEEFDVLMFEALPGKERPPAAGPAPVVKLLEVLFSTALNAGATALHVDAVENRLDIRYQVDGLFYDLDSVPPDLTAPLLDRLKRQTGLDPARSDWPQSSDVTFLLAGRRYRAEISSHPNSPGESIVLKFSSL